MTSTSGRLHCEFVCLLFLTDSCHLQEFILCNPTRSTISPCDVLSRVIEIQSGTHPWQGYTLTVLRINLKTDGVPVPSRSHTHPQFTLSHLPSLNLVSIFRCSSPPRTPVKLIQITWCILLEISFIVNEFIFQVVLKFQVYLKWIPLI